MQRAMGHLMIIVPITVAAIFFLLFILFNSLRLATLIITVLPFASIGGVIGLFASGEYLSVPASVGFIALWGIAVLNGVVLVSYIRKLREEGLDVREAARQGATMRFRPVMMTATVALLGLVPFLFSTGPGSEVQRPLAIVVIGGSSPPPCSRCSFCPPSTASSTANRSKPEGSSDDRDQGRHPPRKARHSACRFAPVAPVSGYECRQGRRMQRALGRTVRTGRDQARPAGLYAQGDGDDGGTGRQRGSAVRHDPSRCAYRAGGGWSDLDHAGRTLHADHRCLGLGGVALRYRRFP
jgi:hypothetical protein